MKTVVRIIIDICIVVLIVLFLFSLLYFCNGSLEMLPTAEQQDKARTVAGLGMALSGVTCTVCIGIRIILLRKKQIN